MKKSSILFLQGILILIGMSILVLLLWEPHVEGVNAHATTLSDIYFDDPFLMFVCVGAIPFFVALSQAFKLLGYIRRNIVFSPASAKSLRTIKYCALITIGFVVVEEAFIMMNHGNDDDAGGIFMGMLITFGSIVVATTAGILERMLESAVDMKAENNVTI